MKKAEKTMEDIVAAAAKRLDGIVAKAGRANGIITARNFRISQGNVYLQGAELSMVGTGYAGKGNNLEERVESIVDAVEAALKDAPAPKLSKSQQRRVEEQAKAGAEDEKTDGEENGDASDEEDEEDGEEGDEAAPADGKLGEYLALTATQLKEMCKARNITIPRGATKQVMAELLAK